MNNVLIYFRQQNSESVAEQTATQLGEQLQQLGFNVELAHVLNLPRLILNSYDTVHLIIEDLPLTVNEAFHLAVCKALGKSTVLSLLNSDKKAGRNFLDYVKPDAFSVSQTNHLKLYRHITGNKFIFPAFPKTENGGRKTAFEPEAFLIPLQTRLEEASDYKIDSPVYFDGRKLLRKSGSAQLRKKWNELISDGKLPAHSHLILSEQKLNQLLKDEALAVVLADPTLRHSEFTVWLNRCLNKNNLVILNEYQATGFSYFWSSGQNCLVLQADGWKKQLEQLTWPNEIFCSSYKVSALFEPTVNELSRLYSKLWHQKTSLLTSGSVKL